MRLLLLSAVPLLMAAQPGPHATERDTVLAEKSGATVTRAELENYLLLQEESLRAATIGKPERLAEIVNGLLTNKILVRDARAAGIHERPEVQAEMQRARDRVLIRHWIEEYGFQHQQGDVEQLAREQYLANRKAYMEPASVDVSHILVSTENRGEAEALERARMIRQRIADGEIGFAEAVAEYSDDQGSLGSDGRYDNVRRGRMVKPFEETAFSLEVGQLSEPVKSRFGYHLILVHAKHPARQKPFEEVREQIEQRVAVDLRQQARQAYQDAIRTELPEVNTEALKAFVREYTAQAAESAAASSSR